MGQRARLAAVIAALALMGSLLVGAPRAVAADGCDSGRPPAFFLGVVYDAEVRHDFVADVGIFEVFLQQLRTAYCIQPTAATLLSFTTAHQGPTTSRPWTVGPGSEAMLKSELARLGDTARATAGSTFFYFSSSHGSMWTGALTEACPPTRLAGSFADLGPGGGEDGFLDDCELGQEMAAHLGDVPAVVAIDCSFCGGFSDSLTAASGTVPDGGVPVSAGVVHPSRIVITACAVTTECFGSSEGGNLFRLMRDVLAGGVTACDGWSAPAFPEVQGLDLPVRDLPHNPRDGRCTASELFFAAVWQAYLFNAPGVDDAVLTIQQQFRIKYGPATLAGDIPFA